MRPERVLDHLTPPAWVRVSARRAFANATERAADDDVQLSASQRLGVVPQAQLMEAEDQKYMLALSGTDNFKHVEPDDFVISLRSFEGGFEHSAYRGCVSPAYTVLRPRRRLDPGYFRHLFKSHLFRQMLAAFNVGVRDGKSIRYEDFSEFLLALPPIDQQRRIADFLDRETARIDALIEKKTRFIDLLLEKRRAVVTRLVSSGAHSNVQLRPTGLPWCDSIPAHWRLCALKYSWTVVDCKHLTAEFVDDGIPLASIREVQGKYVDLTFAKMTTYDYYTQLIDGGRKPEVGDLIFSRNATVGEVAQVPTEPPQFAMGQDVCLLRRIDPAESPDYLQAVIRSALVTEQLEVTMIGATFKRVNVEEIRNLVVPVPPPAEQALIAARIDAETSAIDRLQTRTARSIDLLRERRVALITAAVIGQIDVRAEQPAEDLEPA